MLLYLIHTFTNYSSSVLLLIQSFLFFCSPPNHLFYHPSIQISQDNPALFPILFQSPFSSIIPFPSYIHSIPVAAYIRSFIFSSKTDPARSIGVDGWGVYLELVLVIGVTLGIGSCYYIIIHTHTYILYCTLFSSDLSPQFPILLSLLYSVFSIS